MKLRDLLRRPAHLPRRRGRLTREGKAFVFVTVGVGLAAVNTGNNLLYLMLGLMLSILMLSMVLSELALRAVRVRRQLPSRAFAGSPCLLELALENRKKRLPSYSLEVEDEADGEPTDRRCYFLKVAPGGEQTAAYRRTPAKRGDLALTGYKVRTRYPFGLVEKTHLYRSGDSMLVYPALAEVDPSFFRGLKEGTERPIGRVGPGTEIAGVRDYHDGDEARAIQWRRSASLARLVVRERERDAASRITLVLDNARPEGAAEAWDAGFELAVSKAAALAAAALGRGSAVDVVARGAGSEVVLPGSPPDPIWAFLARLEAVPANEAPALSAPRGAARSVDVVPVRQRAEGAEVAEAAS